MSGYELLASRISSGTATEPPVPAIFRRFSELHNRVLLSMLDDINLMEEQMHYLDVADHHNRMYRDTVLPASRRLEMTEPNEVTMNRKHLLDQVSHKLIQYGKAGNC